MHARTQLRGEGEGWALLDTYIRILCAAVVIGGYIFHICMDSTESRCFYDNKRLLEKHKGAVYGRLHTQTP